MKKLLFPISILFLMVLCSPTCEASGDINFANWELQLPIVSSTNPSDVQTISPSQLQSGFTNAYFYIGKDGGQVFMDPATGATTPGTLHPRSELREMTTNGLAAWYGSGTHVLTVTGEVVQVDGKVSGHTVIAQVHQSTSDSPLFTVIYSNKYKGFAVAYHNGQGPHFENLNYPYPLKTPYTIQLSVINYVVQIKINHTLVFTQTIDPSLQNNTLYFKCGNYDLTAMRGPVNTVPYSIVKDFAINVIHNSVGSEWT